ncbi:class I SAM-dependent methyltransferase [Brevundimonas lenta]|uniref:Putative methyltransferase n=1 Tax=Brevundimonas lenta TaxID=424796 RepID=A0A7W6JEW6_9CAUL|nr:class I SAM-dependent methyltransferase [Brevundimonas lenta]MBB4082876.1 putative methyltransferase [Brevundimonas lenta]
MRRSVILAVSAVLALSPFAAVAQTGPQPAAFTAALADSVRTPGDRARDEVRHPAETLAFAEVEPGQKVVDMIIGGGYFTRTFSAAVGPEGHVTAWQPEQFVAFDPGYGAALMEVDALVNVEGLRTPIGEPGFPSGQDLIFTAQNYHDLHLRPFPADTASRVNAAAFAALKPGGLYVIIDHNAVAGSDLAVADDLHRIDIETVKREVEAAGFVLDGQSDLLANTTDPLTANVFDDSIRGHTSQFMLRFKKPE